MVPRAPSAAAGCNAAGCPCWRKAGPDRGPSRRCHPKADIGLVMHDLFSALIGGVGDLAPCAGPTTGRCPAGHCIEPLRRLLLPLFWHGSGTFGSAASHAHPDGLAAHRPRPGLATASPPGPGRWIAGRSRGPKWAANPWPIRQMPSFCAAACRTGQYLCMVCHFLKLGNAYE